jgi:hypothetical protein
VNLLDSVKAYSSKSFSRTARCASHVATIATAQHDEHLLGRVRLITHPTC